MRCPNQYRTSDINFAFCLIIFWRFKNRIFIAKGHSFFIINIIISLAFVLGCSSCQTRENPVLPAIYISMVASSTFSIFPIYLPPCYSVGNTSLVFTTFYFSNARNGMCFILYYLQCGGRSEELVDRGCLFSCIL